MRKRLLERNAPPEWNVRAFTDSDFWMLCAADGIIVQEAPLERHGFQFKQRNQHVIFINSRLRGAERSFVLWHEYAHYLLHPPGIQFFHGYESQVENEADVFAACAMIPRSLLEHYWPSEIADLYGYPVDLVAYRQDLFERYKL